MCSRSPASRRTSAKAVIEVEKIDVFYGTSQILFGVSLSVNEGQTVALLGRNGAGKSTTLKAIAGLVAPRAGRVKVLGIEMQNRRPHAIARAGVGLVPEDRQIFPEHTVEDNLLLGAKKGRELSVDPLRINVLGFSSLAPRQNTNCFGPFGANTGGEGKDKSKEKLRTHIGLRLPQTRGPI